MSPLALDQFDTPVLGPILFCAVFRHRLLPTISHRREARRCVGVLKMSGSTFTQMALLPVVSFKAVSPLSLSLGNRS